MACGCNKNRGVYRNSPSRLPSNGSITPASQLRQQAVPPKHPAAANAEKNKIQSLRREAIRKALNK
jgi:hypothetical protein